MTFKSHLINTILVLLILSINISQSTRCVVPRDYILEQNQAANVDADQAQGPFISGYNSAYAFNAQDERLSFGNTNFGGATSFSFWAKFDQLDTGARVIDFAVDAYHHNIVIMVSGTQLRFIEMKGNDPDNYAPNRIQQFGPELSIGSWDQYTITVDDSGSVKMYKNGVYGNDEENADNKSSTQIAKVDRTYSWIGCSHFDGDPPLRGSIDAFRVYNRVLTASEITCLKDKENYCRRQCKTCSPDFDTCSSCIGTAQNQRNSSTCLCNESHYDNGTDNCQQYLECTTRHPLLKIKTWNQQQEPQIGYFTTADLDTILGNTTWDSATFSVVNLRNGMKKDLIFTRASSGDSSCKLETIPTDFFFQDNDYLDFQKLGCHTCQDQYYLAANNECLQCDTSLCATCSGTADGCSLRCGDSCKTCDKNGLCTSCNLSNEFIDPNDGACKPCHFKCGTCTTTRENCESCSDLTTRVLDQQCACKTKHFQDGSNTVCGTCDHQCDQCNTNSSTCDGCSDSNRDPEDSCNCVPGYYNENINPVCQVCDNTRCATCSAWDTCTLPCDGTCKTCGTNGKCLTCEEIGEFLDNGECKPCAVQCKKCSGSATHCTECSDLTTRDFNTNQCSCKTKHFQNGNNILCGVCDHQCDQCNTNSSTCDGCSDATRDPADSCNCRPGYYNHNQETLCKDCDNTRCATCSSWDTCTLACGGTCKTCGTDGLCTSCEEIGEFLDNGVCKPCDVQCKKCSGSATHCTECSDLTTRDFNSNQCSCKTKHFQNGNNILCGTCEHQCDQCLTNANNCQGCSHDTRDPLDSCNCKPGYYNLGIQERCEICDNTICATCSDRNTCTLDCDATCKTCGTNGKCLTCEYYGEFLDNGECKPCAVQCKRCSGSNTHCIECSDVATRDFNSNQCSCKTKHFQDANNAACGSCSYKCDQCLTTADNCQGCSHDTRDSSNSCNCKPGYYNVGEDAQCLICDHSVCATCEGTPDNCTLRCNENCRTCDHTGNCSLCNLNGEYYKDGICHNCNFKCGSCTNQAENCTSCSDTNRDSDNNCLCSIGYYQNENEKLCGKCHHKCQNCENNSLNCITCSHETRDSDNSCFCKQGYYNFEEEAECRKCNNRICGTCTGAETCIQSCHDSCSTCNLEGACISCKLGWFLKDGICQKCNEKCFACENDKDNCTLCSGIGEGRLNSLEKECGCKYGYYEIEGQLNCQVCQGDNCKHCNTSGQCLECLNPLMLPPSCLIFKDQHYISFETGNTENNLEIKETGQCAVQCNSCQDRLDNCLECSDGKNRNVFDLPNCKCLDGYHDNNGKSKDCQKCPFKCLQCQNDQMCDQCEEEGNFKWNAFSGQCECKLGYKLNEKSETCQKCFFHNGECLFKCPSEMKEDKEKMTCQEIIHIEQHFSDSAYSFITVAAVLTGTGLIFSTFVAMVWIKKLSVQSFSKIAQVVPDQAQNNELFEIKEVQTLENQEVQEEEENEKQQENKSKQSSQNSQDYEDGDGSYTQQDEVDCQNSFISQNQASQKFEREEQVQDNVEEDRVSQCSAKSKSNSSKGNNSSSDNDNNKTNINNSKNRQNSIINNSTTFIQINE